MWLGVLIADQLQISWPFPKARLKKSLGIIIKVPAWRNAEILRDHGTQQPHFTNGETEALYTPVFADPSW